MLIYVNVVVLGYCDWHEKRRCKSIKGCTDHFPQRYSTIFRCSTSPDRSDYVNWGKKIRFVVDADTIYQCLLTSTTHWPSPVF